MRVAPTLTAFFMMDRSSLSFRWQAEKLMNQKVGPLANLAY